MLVDKMGNSAVVEWVDGEIKIVKKKGAYQIITNFWLSNPKLGNYPCDRYDKVKNMLNNLKNISINDIKNILEAVSKYKKISTKKEIGTIYSNIYDLKKGEIYIFYKRDYLNLMKFNLKKELKKGRKIYELKNIMVSKN